MLAVIDTNVLVSALMSRNGAPARVMSLVFGGRLTLCYDHRILREYRNVLRRPKFGFADGEIAALLDWIAHYGLSVVAEPLDGAFTDESDKKFYEVAKFCGAVLITGNLKHYPHDPQVISVSAFLEQAARGQLPMGSE